MSDNYFVMLIAQLRTMGGDIVTLLVGTDKVSFTVHKKILCSRVKYFDRMFNGDFLESKTGEATFPEDDPVAFDILLFYIYTNKLSGYSHPTTHGFSLYLHLYMLADRFVIPEVQDRCIDAIINTDISDQVTVEDLLKSQDTAPGGSYWAKMTTRLVAFRLQYNEYDVNEADAAKLIQGYQRDASELVMALRKQAQRHPTTALKDL